MIKDNIKKVHDVRTVDSVRPLRSDACPVASLQHPTRDAPPPASRTSRASSVVILSLRSDLDPTFNTSTTRFNVSYQQPSEPTPILSNRERVRIINTTDNMEEERLWKFRRPEWLNSVAARNAGVYSAGALVRAIISNDPSLATLESIKHRVRFYDVDANGILSSIAASPFAQS